MLEAGQGLGLQDCNAALQPIGARQAWKPVEIVNCEKLACYLSHEDCIHLRLWSWPAQKSSLSAALVETMRKSSLRVLSIAFWSICSNGKLQYEEDLNHGLRRFVLAGCPGSASHTGLLGPCLGLRKEYVWPLAGHVREPIIV